MLRARTSLWAAVLLVRLLPAGQAQSSHLTYFGATVCCIATDPAGNNFVVSSSTAGSTTVTVEKLDAAGDVLATSSFQTGAGAPSAAAVDPSGNLWIVGSRYLSAASSGPIVGAIAEIDSTGTQVLYNGTFGGVDTEGYTSITAMAFDSAGNLHIAGPTTQSDFPVTPGALTGSGSQSFIAKLAPASQSGQPYTVAYAALLGANEVPDPLPCPSSGTCYQLGAVTDITALAVNSDGIVTVAGTTTASNFPVTTGAYQTAYQGGDNVPNVFVTRLNAQGSGLVWSTYVGEVNGTGTTTPVAAVALDSAGNVVLTGVSSDSQFPITAGAIQSQIETPTNGATSIGNGFVAKLNSSGTSLLFSTYYGMVGTTGMAGPRLRLDAGDNIWITEPLADTTGLVLPAGSLSAGTNLIAGLAADGSGVLFSELVPDGMAGVDLVLNGDGSMSVAGACGYLLRQPRSAPAGVSILGFAPSAASSVTTTVAPGEYVSIYGSGLGLEAGAVMQVGTDGLVTTSLGGTQVLFNGIAAPLIYASANQINALAPYGIASGSQVNVTVTTSGGTSQTLPLEMVSVRPIIIAVLNADGSMNSSTHPATVGSTVTILVSGAGALDATYPDGTIAASPAPVPAAAVGAAFTVTIEETSTSSSKSVPATPSYAGGIPGSVVNLLSVTVPVPDLPQLGSSPFRVTVSVGGTYAPTFTFYAAAAQ